MKIIAIQKSVKKIREKKANQKKKEELKEKLIKKEKGKGKVQRR